MELEYKYIKDINRDKLVELFSSVSWKTAEYPNRLYNAIKNSRSGNRKGYLARRAGYSRVIQLLWSSEFYRGAENALYV